MHGYTAKFIGGGPLSRKHMMVVDDRVLVVQKPHDFSIYRDFRADVFEPKPAVQGTYTPWAVDQEARRIVYVWDGWSK